MESNHWHNSRDMITEINLRSTLWSLKCFKDNWHYSRDTVLSQKCLNIFDRWTFSRDRIKQMF